MNTLLLLFVITTMLLFIINYEFENYHMSIFCLVLGVIPASLILIARLGG